MNLQADTLPMTLRQARKACRVSQLELSLRVGVSQRHVSFVEGGRAKPSRPLLLAWMQALGAPLVVRNAAMLQAGYAPVYGAAPLNDPTLAQANDALAQLLRAHDPQPALILDAHWNVLGLSRGGQWLAVTLMPWIGDLPKGAPMNMLDLLIHPEGMTRAIVNLHEVGTTLLAHLRDAAAAHPSLAPKVNALAALLHTRFGASDVLSAVATQSRTTAPVLTTRFATVHGELAFFSMFTTFGTPQDITLASLRVEHLFAADEVTAAVLRTQVL
jgi:transcriptional regulator with XRE-family HTH domain